MAQMRRLRMVMLKDPLTKLVGMQSMCCIQFLKDWLTTIRH